MTTKLSLSNTFAQQLLGLPVPSLSQEFNGTPEATPQTPKPTGYTPS